MILPRKQPIFCNACGRRFTTDFVSKSSNVCSELCADDLKWLRRLARKGQTNRPNPATHKQVVYVDISGRTFYVRGYVDYFKNDENLYVKLNYPYQHDWCLFRVEYQNNNRYIITESLVVEDFYGGRNIITDQTRHSFYHLYSTDFRCPQCGQESVPNLIDVMEGYSACLNGHEWLCEWEDLY